MKALTLTQPWASLVALGEKHIETRSWYTGYRGLLAIHAGMCFPGWAKRQCFIPPFSDVLVRHGLSPDNLPLGRVLCLARLENCISTGVVEKAIDLSQFSPNEEEFGNFDLRRFAWVLGPVTKVFDPLIYAKGMLGLWEWSEPQ